PASPASRASPPADVPCCPLSRSPSGGTPEGNGASDQALAWVSRAGRSAPAGRRVSALAEQGRQGSPADRAELGYGHREQAGDLEVVAAGQAEAGGGHSPIGAETSELGVRT